jgi:hypothetical protein
MPRAKGANGEAPKATCVHCRMMAQANNMARHLGLCLVRKDAMARNQVTVDFRAGGPSGRLAADASNEIADFDEPMDEMSAASARGVSSAAGCRRRARARCRCHRRARARAASAAAGLERAKNS